MIIWIYRDVIRAKWRLNHKFTEKSFRYFFTISCWQDLQKNIQIIESHFSWLDQFFFFEPDVFETKWSGIALDYMTISSLTAEIANAHSLHFWFAKYNVLPHNWIILMRWIVRGKEKEIWSIRLLVTFSETIRDRQHQVTFFNESFLMTVLGFFEVT